MQENSILTFNLFSVIMLFRILKNNIREGG